MRYEYGHGHDVIDILLDSREEFLNRSLIDGFNP